MIDADVDRTSGIALEHTECLRTHCQGAVLYKRLVNAYCRY